MHLKQKMGVAIAAALALAASSGVHAAPGTRPTAGRSTPQGLLASPSTCDPFSDWDDIDPDGSGSTDGGDDSTTNNLLPGLRQAPTSGRMATGRDAARVIGTTPEAIQRNFIGVIAGNLSNAGTASRIARLSDRELAAIAMHAAQGVPAERAGLLKLFATRLDAAALVRVARAFGRAPVTAAVHVYSDREVREAYDSGVAGLTAPPPEGGGGGGSTYPSPSPPRPTVDMTLEEIYLEYRTAPVGSLSPAGALAETAQFAGIRLSAAYWAGSEIGAGISWLIQHYAPELDNAIGATIASMIENFWEASGEAQQGHFEAAFDSLFGFPVTNSSDPWGDWDITEPMVFYYQQTDTCGW